VQKGSERELAGLGQPRAFGHCRLDDRAEEYRAPVPADLDDIFAGVGVRSGKDREYDLVGRAPGGLQPREGRVPWLEHGLVQCQRRGNCRRLWTADPHDADAAPSDRRCDGDNRVLDAEHDQRSVNSPALSGAGK
jgi:hypothetical protein